MAVTLTNQLTKANFSPSNPYLWCISFVSTETLDLKLIFSPQFPLGQYGFFDTSTKELPFYDIFHSWQDPWELGKAGAETPYRDDSLL